MGAAGGVPSAARQGAPLFYRVSGERYRVGIDNDLNWKSPAGLAVANTSRGRKALSFGTREQLSFCSVWPSPPVIQERTGRNGIG